ncbi:MAG TPA: enoyl-CoA hydratase [Gammaproteobacteria bacterium]
MAPNRILVEQTGYVARVIINHPERRNAIGYEMWRAFGDALAAIAENEEVQVVILTGAGDKAFCAGNDISEFSEWMSSKQKHEKYDRQSNRAVRLLQALAKPVIARIHGVCVGGGFELAQLCDIQIAADDARFGVTPAKLGIGYSLNDTTLLTDRIAARFVRELLYTGRMFGAKDALRMGIVNQVVPADKLDETVDGYASEIAGNAPLSIRASKIIITQALRPDGKRDLALCERMVDACRNSDDAAEGRRAFSEKRRPVFRGK